MLRERINELEEIIAVMDGDREQLRAKIEEGATKSKEQYGKILNYSELLVTENRSLTQ
jgi:myosin heavy subunit